MSDENNNEDLLFHRHCQATVLSAYGPTGHGATWSTINNLSLTNLDGNWKTDFTRNTDNITEDLASILKLINNVAGKTATPTYTLEFKNNKNSLITSGSLSPNGTATFGGFGRDITLKVNGQPLSFNTMFPNQSESTSITIPIPTLTPGDIVQIVPSGNNNTIKVKNNIRPNYNGPIGINSSRELTEFTIPTPPTPEVKLTQNMFNQLWPLGSIYISINNTQPFQGIEGVSSTWTLIGTGRTLWNTTDAGELNNNLGGIFPKHTHSHDKAPEYYGHENDLTDKQTGWVYVGRYTTGTTGTPTLDPSVSNVTVGTTLRPPSFGVTMWKRTR